MNIFTKFFLFLSMTTLIDASHDNFMVTFNKDLRVFGLRKRGGASPPRHGRNGRRGNLDKVEEVKQKDDFDQAEETIFNKVENVEKVVLNKASALIHDEVDAIFGSETSRRLHKPRKSIVSEKGKKEIENTSMKSKRKVKKEPEEDNRSEFMKIFDDGPDFIFE